MTVVYCAFAPCYEDADGEHHDLRFNSVTCPSHPSCLVHGGVHFKVPVPNGVIKDLSDEGNAAS